MDRHPIYVLALSLGLGAIPAKAAIIYNANFLWAEAPEAQVNDAPGDGFAGVVELDGWSDILEDALISSSTSVLSRDGTDSADFSATGLQADTDEKTFGAAPPSEDNDQLMSRGIRSGSSGNSITITVSGLSTDFSNSTFDLIVYFVNTESPLYNGVYSLEQGGVKRYGEVTTSFSDPGDTGAAFTNAGQSDTLGGAGSVNYLIIEDIAGSETFSFTVANETGSRVIVQGVQLVAIPEPSPAVLSLISLLCAAAFHRRRAN